MSNSISGVDIRNVGEPINSSYSEFSPIFRDSLTIYFSSVFADTVQNYDFGEANFHLVKILKSEKDEFGNWQKPQKITKINKLGFQTANGTFNSSQTKFFFTKCKTFTGNKSNCHIYVSDVIGEKFLSPKKLKEPVNIANFNSTQPFLAEILIDSKLESVLFFTSDRQGGIGNFDLYYAILNEKSEIKSFSNLGDKVNSMGNEITPFYDKTTNELYFSSDYWQGLGGYDVFKTEGSLQTWSAPQNIGFPYNSSTDEMSFVLNNFDGNAYFSSNRVGGHSLVSETCCDDLFMANFKRQQGLIVSFYHYNGKKISKDSVAYKIKSNKGQNNINLLSDSLRAYFFVNEQSNYELKAFYEKDTIQTEIIIAPKINLINKSDTTKSNIKVYQKSKYWNEIAIYLKQKKDEKLVSDSVPNEQTVVDLPSEFKFNNTEGEIVDTADILKKDFEKFSYTFYFPYKQSDFIKDQKHNFDFIVKLLKSHPKNKVIIEAHTDNIGNDAYNIFLSQSRAERIKLYLVENGIDKKKIKAIGFGEKFPAEPNTFEGGLDNVFGRAKNRRAIIRVGKDD
jgi:outer membrane protein OmpA-like peptidoglycan-associated protein